MKLLFYTFVFLSFVSVTLLASEKAQLTITFDNYPFVSNSKLPVNERVMVINSLLDLLKENKIQATFFVNALSFTKEFDSVTKRLIREGHRLGKQAYIDIHSQKQSSKAGRNILVDSNKIIDSYDRGTPRYFRIPTDEVEIEKKHVDLNWQKKSNYQIVPTTLEFVNGPYKRYLGTASVKGRDQVIKEYVEEILYVLKNAEKKSKLLNAPHIMAFQLNEMTNLSLPKIFSEITTLYNIVPLEFTLEQEFFKWHQQDMYSGSKFITFDEVYSSLSLWMLKTNPSQFFINLKLRFLITLARISLFVFYYYNILLIILLLFVSLKALKGRKLVQSRFDMNKPSLTVLVPAYNESQFLRECVEALVKARYQGDKNILIINDASVDQTGSIADHLEKKFDNVRVLHNGVQLGKAGSLNRGLDQSTTELIAVVDGDSVVDSDALEHVGTDFLDPKVDATGGVVFVKFRFHPIHMILNIQVMYLSLFRLLMSKIRSNILTPGPLSVFKRDVVNAVGGFNTDGLCEDLEIAVRIQEAGYKLKVNSRARVGTYFPKSIWFILKQQVRWVSGTLYVIRRKLNIKSLTPIQLFVFPIMILGFFNTFVYTPGVVMNLMESLPKVSTDWTMTLLTWLNHLTIFQNWEQIHSLFVELETYKLEALLRSSFYSSIVDLAGVIIYFSAVFIMFRIRNLTAIVGFIFVPSVWLIISISTLLSFRALFVKEQKNIWKKELQKEAQELSMT